VNNGIYQLTVPEGEFKQLSGLEGVNDPQVLDSFLSLTPDGRWSDLFAPLATIRIYDDGPQNDLPIATNRRCVRSIPDFASAPSILGVGLNRTAEVKILAPRLNLVIF
jgi:hypothetical protein